MDKKDQKNQKIDLKGFWARLWSLLLPLRKNIKKLFLLTVIFEMSRFIGPYILKHIIDLIVSFDPERIFDIVLLIFALFASGQLTSLIDYFLDKKIFRAIIYAERYLPVKAQEKMLFLSLNYHEKENTGNKVSKVDRGVDKIVNLLGNFFWDVAPTLTQAFLTMVILFFVDFRFGLLYLVIVPAFVFLSFKANKKVFPFRKKRHDDYEKSSGMMAQSIININTVKSFVQEEREKKEYESVREKISKNTEKEFFVILKYGWGRNFIIDIGRLSILFLGVYFVYIGNISIGSLVFVITISDKALISLFRISRLYDKIMESSEAIDRLYFLDKEKSNIKNPKNGYKPKKITGRIEFKNVSYAYDEARKNALEDVSLCINSGCVTALVGPSGGGKTTVAKMVYRHYDPLKGRVFLDDKDLRDYDLYAFRKHIAIVPQEVEIFNSSIRGNISYSNPKASLKEIKAAARTANAEEFILNLSHGYDTLVGERGIKLSGGQRQRIGIARAILANPKILIFDEATSSLDSYSEKLIQEAMERISKNRTMIIIAHRLSTIRRADKIIALENGRVVEQGGHIELANKKGGIYAKLLRLQKMGDVGK
jgi:ABC-type multidrug transport system fused ATPase/permease subunit